MTSSLVAPPERLLRAFQQLADAWRAGTRYLSSTTELAMHPAYQRIIGFGPQVIPLILAELAKQPEPWFWALVALTGENPVPAEDRGRVRAMTDAWMNWGRENGWIA
jgi:hypothetical protein